jgi:4-amino-4-deoxy-L-arabinose transferase-like glycosyltransferase
MLLVWALFVFVFFSISQSKLMPYIVPMWPAVALLAGRSVSRLSASNLARHLRAMAVFAAAVALLLMLLWRLPAAAALVARASTASIMGFTAAFALLAIAAGLGARLARQSQPIAAALATGFGGWMLAQGALLAAEQLPRMQALVQLETQVRPFLNSSTHIYCVNDYLQPIAFYWRRACTLVGYRGELDFGLRQEPWLWVANLQQFERDWQEQSDALALLRPEDYERLQALGLPMHVIYTAQSLVAVVRR